MRTPLNVHFILYYPKLSKELKQAEQFVFLGLLNGNHIGFRVYLSIYSLHEET